jgi:hypothetical protein
MWHGDPNGEETTSDQNENDETAAAVAAKAAAVAEWPRWRGSNGRAPSVNVHVFDSPSCRVGGEEAQPGETLWQWLGEHGLHDSYTSAKARIL